MTTTRNRAIPSLETLECRATPAVVTSTFDTNLDGWTTIRNDNQGAGATNLQWRATGGHPGGQAQATDIQDSKNWVWRAPPKFRGNQIDKYNTHLTFDLRQTATDLQDAGNDLLLSGKVGNQTINLVIDFRRNPGTAWTSYAAKLTEAGGWRVLETNLVPTAAQFQAVLGNVTDLRIRGEYSSRQSTGGLDNVVLGGAAPTLVINGAIGREGANASLSFAVSLSHVTAAPVTVTYSTANGSALAGSDYVAASNASLTFNVGETAKTIKVSLVNNRVREANEAFAVNLTSATNVSILWAQAVGIIQDDD